MVEKSQNIIKADFRVKEEALKKNFPEVYQEIMEFTKNIQNASFSERKYCFINNISQRPLCKICQKEIPFQNFTKGYLTYCSLNCKYSDNDLIQKSKNTCLKRYGQDNPAKVDIFKEKAKETYLIKSEGKYTSNLQDPFERAKHQQIKEEKYGNPNFTNREKFKETWYKNRSQHKDWKEVWENLSDTEKVNRIKKGQHTKLQKYGNETYNNPNKIKSTCLEKYGVDNVSKREEFKELFKDRDFLESLNMKKYQTKKKNHSFNTSKTEELVYELLKTKFKEVYHHKSNNLETDKQLFEKFPFEYDFYIPELDTFIEFNGNWTHGKEPFDKDKPEHISQLNDWLEKSSVSEYYRNAIYVWTNLDIRRREIAKKNGLKYLEFWNVEQLNNWVDKY